ncbi:MAG TPA: hypothetical protein VLA13_04030 [Massilibacterium sp.]|nr:hypothetical protein [Massilibacterium sp.]
MKKIRILIKSLYNDNIWYGTAHEKTPETEKELYETIYSMIDCDIMQFNISKFDGSSGVLFLTRDTINTCSFELDEF